jgi:deoxyribonuclease IV
VIILIIIDNISLNMINYLGHCISTKHGLISSSKYAETVGANFYQIFLTSAQQYHAKRHTKEALLSLKEELNKRNQKIVVHGSYMLNFCNPPQSYKHKEAVNLLTQDMVESVHVGAIGVIIHMGKNCSELGMTKETAINNYVLGIKKVLSQTPKESTVILETGAGVGTEVCTDLFSLGSLRKRFNSNEQKRIKFCLDTCHMFAAGYSFSFSDYVDLVIQIIKDNLGWNNVVCIHLNDSKCPANCRKDRHADIGKGLINLNGLKKFVLYCSSLNIPIVLETPCENNFNRKDQITLVRSWFDKKEDNGENE